MARRLVVQMHTKPGKGADLAAMAAERCLVVQQEDGCEQFEVFQSAVDPDKFTLLILWRDQAALDAHNALAANQPASPWTAALRDPGSREDYEYNRTR